jgi:glycosyltransferase involved in cell wall biosynthesis
MRILHVVGKLDRGGAETWLVQVLRHIDREKYQMDFLVHTTDAGAYDEEVRSLGVRIIPCLGYTNPMRYARNFLRILRQYGPYDCVHSHVHLFSGYVAAIAAANRVPLRLVQSHFDSTSAEQEYNFVRRSYARMMRRLIFSAANSRIAVSRAAGDSLFGNAASSARTWSYLPLGIDLEPYKNPVSRDAIRAELGLAGDSVAIFHIGRFDEPKNHKFLVEIAASLCAIDPHVRLFFVGDGPLRPRIQDQVRSYNLDEWVQFLGVRADVPRLLKGAADLFLFPSLYEGLGLVHMEAQLAGLRSIVSDVVPTEADILPTQVIRLPLAKPAATWAQDIAGVIRSGLKRWAPDLSTVEAAVSIEASVKHLSNLYSATLARASTSKSFIATTTSVEEPR